MDIKLTKNELKHQKDQLKQFERYLPTLQLKKQQLQAVIRQINSELENKEKERLGLINNLDSWVSVFSENSVFPDDMKIQNLITPDIVEKGIQNIAGVEIPVFFNLTFKEVNYEISNYPLWVDTALIRLKEIAMLDAFIKTLKQQVELLSRELQITSQRVNLFEKVKIPESKENIRVISIYLGDQQTSAVVRGKIAKKKLQERGATQ